MTTILSLETATTNCSVALSVDGKTTCIKEVNNQKYSHAENLHQFINQILDEVNLSVNDLDAIAVSKGPGSYTGLRIGVSAAKGLCFAADLPLISISTLDSLAKQVDANADEVIVPMLDARRMEVYSKIVDSNNKTLEPTEAKILDNTSYQTVLDKQKVHFIGSGVSKFKTICQHKNATFHLEKDPSARQMGDIAYEKFQEKDFEDVAYFEPYYLKDFMPG
ncbi:MAG: tRNA (adenosine(37)-N6)-threonylcarbamoyltransferase complex dimerization subunit type 1 TsaB [Bacteroidota bacterium]